MTKDDAIRTAQPYIAQRFGTDLKIRGQTVVLSLRNAKLETDGTWSVIYNITLPGSITPIVDGPIVVVVDPSHDNVCLLEEYMKKT